MSKQRTTIILTSILILLSAGFMGYYYYRVHHLKEPLPVLGNEGHHIEPFAFTNQEGKTITEKDVAGKVFVVEYFFSTCKGQCPRMNNNMEKVYQAYKGNKNFLILSHTVDPKRDSAAALKAYALQFDADPNQWMFLTGSKKDLYDHARNSYLISALDDTTGLTIDKDFIHDQHFALVDKQGRIRGLKNAVTGIADSYNGLDTASVQQLITDIGVLLNE